VAWSQQAAVRPKWPPVSVTDACSPPSNRICRSTPAKTVVSLVALAVQLVQRWEVLSLIGTLFSANQDTPVSGTAPAPLLLSPAAQRGVFLSSYVVNRTNLSSVRQDRRARAAITLPCTGPRPANSRLRRVSFSTRAGKLHHPMTGGVVVQIPRRVPVQRGTSSSWLSTSGPLKRSASKPPISCLRWTMR
jgi:hypothetical protein